MRNNKTILGAMIFALVLWGGFELEFFNPIVSPDYPVEDKQVASIKSYPICSVAYVPLQERKYLFPLNYNKIFHPGLEEMELPAHFDSSYIWNEDRDLRVYFVGTPEEELINKILGYANEWTVGCSLKFVRSYWKSKSDIRIQLKSGNTYWSYVGNRAKQTYDTGGTTMILSDRYDDEEEYKRLVLHEFGHALGLYHELQRPTRPITWERDSVYAFFGRMGWGKSTIEKNILDVVPGSSYSGFDTNSVMLYDIPAFLNKERISFRAGRELSTLDKQEIQRLY